MNKNTLLPWKTLRSKKLLDSKWLKINQEECMLPSGKVINDFYTIWQPNWVLILPKTTTDSWVITKQYRHGTESISLEFPAGIIENGETPLEAAKRELEEESGYLSPLYHFIGEFPMNPDRHRGKFFVFFAENVTPNGTIHQDDTEDITSITLSTEELEHKIQSGEFNHPLQIAAYFKMKLSGVT